MSLIGRQVAGAALAIGGILALEPLLGRYFLPEAFTEFPGNFIAICASFILAATGLALLLWRNRIGWIGITGRETLARVLMVCAPFILLALVEGALILSDEWNPPRDERDKQARQLMKENWGKLRHKTLPLVGPVQSKFLNVNKDGFRTYPLDTPRNGETRILLLGGSTGFGWGVADHHVIDRYLEEALKARTNHEVRVFNLSVPAITFGSENLVLEDFAGRVGPDIVIFYHGANDALAWYEQTVGRADADQTLAPPFWSWATLIHTAYRSNVFRLLMESFAPSKSETPPDIDVSRAIAQYGERLAETRSACARAKCLFFIQPIVFDKRNLTPRETKITRHAALLFPGYETMYGLFTDSLLEKSFPGHVDARAVFAETGDTVFLDYVHVSGAGNRLMAQFMAQTLCDQRLLTCR